MAAALMREDFIGARDGRIEVLRTIDGQYQRELLAGEREIAADSGLLYHEEFLRFRSRWKTAAARKYIGVARDKRAAQFSVRPERGLDLCLIGLGSHVAAGPLERRDSLVVNGVDENDGIFRRTGRRIVENLGGADLACSLVKVGSFIHDHGHIARAHADCRRAA